jgi:hypothetical protein
MNVDLKVEAAVRALMSGPRSEVYASAVRCFGIAVPRSYWPQELAHLASSLDNLLSVVPRLGSLRRIQFKGERSGKLLNVSRELERVLLAARTHPIDSLCLLDAHLPQPQIIRQALPSFGTLVSLQVGFNRPPREEFMSEFASSVPSTVRHLSLSRAACFPDSVMLELNRRLPDLEVLHIDFDMDWNISSHVVGFSNIKELVMKDSRSRITKWANIEWWNAITSRKLEHLSLEFFALNRFTVSQAFADLLRRNRALKFLSLNFVSPSVSLESVRSILVEAYYHVPLQSVTIEAIVTHAPQLQVLELIDVWAEDLDYDLTTLINRWTNLHTLKMSIRAGVTRIQFASLEFISPSIRVLQLDCSLSVDDAAAVAHALHANQTLRRLSIVGGLDEAGPWVELWLRQMKENLPSLRIDGAYVMSISVMGRDNETPLDSVRIHV